MSANLNESTELLETESKNGCHIIMPQTACYPSAGPNTNEQDFCDICFYIAPPTVFLTAGYFTSAYGISSTIQPVALASMGIIMGFAVGFSCGNAVCCIKEHCSSEEAEFLSFNDLEAEYLGRHLGLNVGIDAGVLFACCTLPSQPVLACFGATMICCCCGLSTYYATNITHYAKSPSEAASLVIGCPSNFFQRCDRDNPARGTLAASMTLYVPPRLMTMNP